MMMSPQRKRVDSELKSVTKAKAAFIEPMRTGSCPKALNGSMNKT
jgi:hypothetical protein